MYLERFNVTDKVALVTGGAGAIGLAIADALLEAGAIVVVADRAREPLDEAVQARPGARLSTAVFDVTDPDAVTAAIDAVVAEHGRIDVLVNNAGIFSTLEMRPFDQIPVEEWERVLRVNLTGPFLCARAVLPAMRRGKWGRIINIGSGAVRLGRPNYLHYIAAKAALAGMALSMARELGPDNITVNTILPGATFTEIERKTVTPQQKERIVAMQCVPRPEVPEDLVGAALFLASDAAAFVTGQSINLDGGVTGS